MVLLNCQALGLFVKMSADCAEEFDDEKTCLLRSEQEDLVSPDAASKSEPSQTGACETLPKGEAERSFFKEAAKDALVTLESVEVVRDILGQLDGSSDHKENR